MEEVNASSTRQDQAISDIARQAVEINEISQQLFREINVFQIAEETGADAPAGQLLMMEETRAENEDTSPLLAIAE
ncbi:hypothetical protein D3C75_885740 [compost metagenome]